MDFITPVDITDDEFVSSDVTEDDCDAWVDFEFDKIKALNSAWGCCVDRADTGDVYVCVSGGDIYVQTAGAGSFSALSQTSRSWRGMCAAPDGDIYCCVLSGDIYKRSGGAGDFTGLSQTSRAWYAMAAAPNGDIYACVYGGNIYKQTGGTGAFTGLSQTSRNWSGMCADDDGNIYACVFGGDIYKQTGGTGDFAALGQTSRYWRGMGASPNGDIFAVVPFAGFVNGDVYIQVNGTGNFTALGLGEGFESIGEVEMAGVGVANDNSIYISGGGGQEPGVWYCDGACFYSDGDSVIVTTPNVHKIYESLVDNNFGNYPPDDDQTDPDYWLEVSSTNRWAAFDGTLGQQTEQAGSIEFVLAPGAVDSIALLNIESTSINVTMVDGDSAEIYNTTVVTGISKTDLVLLDLPEYADCEITVTITNTGGTAKIGELIVGTQTNIGITLPNPTFSIKDYSTKTQDVYGQYTIVERGFSKKASCDVYVADDDIDEVARLLAQCRATAKVWIIDPDYAALIAYGFYVNFTGSIPIKDGGAFLPMEIESLSSSTD